jgi:hypothetical protein
VRSSRITARHIQLLEGTITCVLGLGKSAACCTKLGPWTYTAIHVREGVVVAAMSNTSVGLAMSLGLAKLENADDDGHQGQYRGDDAEDNRAG